jgi:hypothetical protein
VILYIAGPMTGYPDYNFPLFNDAEVHLREAGYDVLNPAQRAGKIKGASWQWYLRHGIADVCVADGIATLPNWGKSRGARLEVSVGHGLGMPVRSLKAWLMLDLVAPRGVD